MTSCLLPWGNKTLLKLGSSLKGKNLLLEELILFFKSCLLRKEAKWQSFCSKSVPVYLNANFTSNYQF